MAAFSYGTALEALSTVVTWELGRVNDGTNPCQVPDLVVDTQCTDTNVFPLFLCTSSVQRVLVLSLPVGESDLLVRIALCDPQCHQWMYTGSSQVRTLRSAREGSNSPCERDTKRRA